MSAEERLAHLAALVDASSDAILTKGLDGTITSWNASAERMFGYSSDEIVGANIRTLIPDELQAEEDDILAKIRAGTPIEHYDTVRVARDGRRLDVSLSISPVRDGTGRIVGASKIIRDVSARKRADAALAATTAKFESVFNQSGIFAGIMDVDGTLREVNALAVDACGYNREDVLGVAFWDTPWWRGSEEVQGRIRLATEQAAADEVFRETLPYWLADGSERIVDFAMHPIHDEAGVVRFLHPTGLDVTDRVRAEEALRAKEEAERRIALELQRALLPERLNVPPTIDVAARYEAGSKRLEVGGDWYDAFELPDGRVGLTVGDVVGHGVRAAAAMGQLRTALGALALHAESAGDLLRLLDLFLARTQVTDFATICYAVLDPATGWLEYASGGHPPMLLVSPDGEATLLDGAQSEPLYGREGVERPQASLQLEPGALLVLYSDGLVERRRERLNDRLARLTEIGTTLVGVPAGAVYERLVQALGMGSSQADDVAVLAVRFAPAETAAFHYVFPAYAGELRLLRKAMRGWLDRRPYLAGVRDALLIAVGEAAANSIEHGYWGREPGNVRVDIEQSDHSLVVEITDSGLPDGSAASGSDRGRGTGMIRRLTTEFSRESTPDGTIVRFVVPVEEAVAR